MTRGGNKTLKGSRSDQKRPAISERRNDQGHPKPPVRRPTLTYTEESLMPFYFRIPLPGPFGFSTRIGGRKRRSPARRPAPPAPKVATEAEKVRIAQAIRHAIERADRDAFDLAMARFRDLARAKVGANDLGSIGEIALLPDAERQTLQRHLDVVRDCIGHPEKLATAQAAADQYNLISDKANRRIDMLMSLDTPDVSDADRLERIEIEG